MVTFEEVEKVQEKWGKGVVKMGSLQNDKVALEQACDEHLDLLYAFERGDVLFKPTMAAFKPFRLDKEGAKSYYIGGNTSYPEDVGFALNPWIMVRFENASLILEPDRAMAMGIYLFVDSKGKEIKVEFTFGYIKDSSGELKIDVHHSSVPYQS